MNNKGLLLLAVGILSASIVFAMGKVDAVDSGTTEAAKPQTTGKRYTFDDVERATTNAEKRRILLEIIKSEPKTDEDWAIEQNVQNQRDAAFELMGMNHTREDIGIIINKIEIEKNNDLKRALLDALSFSPYKDLTVKEYKKIAETENDLFIKGLAIYFIISSGYENDGFQYLQKYVDFLNKNENLPRDFYAFSKFKSPEMEEKVKAYLIDLKNDRSNSKAVRSLAAINSEMLYETDIEPYFEIISKLLMARNTQKGTAIYLLEKLSYYGNKYSEAKKIIEKAKSEGNKVVREVTKIIINNNGRYPN